MDEQRKILFRKIMNLQNISYSTMDRQSSRYAKPIFSPVERDVMTLIGKQPGITITEMAQQIQKTPSACSQLARRLRTKGWIQQERDPENNRKYHLVFTEEGWKIYQACLKLDQLSDEYLAEELQDFTVEELETYSRVRERINKIELKNLQFLVEYRKGNME